ncbi:MAG: hypothetical protein Q7V20_20785 [Aquabacterium sp.]|uniref:hypothetical protein n=1 Tax=Aquabacterium sp. TaxID=1872578 RepID=UPI00271E7976|nr:hypothetical protein [Aquabacterium sp.]MDO9005888.1 hypothetical protein [Aquabacterium sp.]
MAAWRLYRHRNADGSSKDWAVRTNPDGSITTRWGKTAPRLAGANTRSGIRQSDIEREKQAKGYVFVAEVDIDGTGNVSIQIVPAPDPQPSKPSPPTPVVALYWHIDCRTNRQTRKALAAEIKRLVGVIHTLSDSEARPEQGWPGWQQLSELTLTAGRFEHSGQIKPAQGVMPWLLLLALKHQRFAGVEIDMATENSREVSADLKAEHEVLAFFGTDLDSIRLGCRNTSTISII